MFNIGDRILCVKKYSFAPVGSIGTIKKVKRRYVVSWDNDVGGWGDPVWGIQYGHGEFVPFEYVDLYIEDKNDLVQEWRISNG